MTKFLNKCLLSKLQKQQAHVKSISRVTVNAQNVCHLHLHKLADVSWNQQSTCGFRLVINRSRFSSALTSVPGCPRSLIQMTELLKHWTPNMIVKWIDVQAIWWPGVFVNKVWTVSCKPLLSHFAACAGSSCWKINRWPIKQLVTVVQ